MPSKVVFQTRVRKISEGTLVCPVPKSLISIERRSAVRSATLPDVMAYLSLGVWDPDESNLGGPLIISTISAYEIMVADILLALVVSVPIRAFQMF